MEEYGFNNTFKIGTIFSSESNAIWTHKSNNTSLYFSDVIGPISLDLKDFLDFPVEMLQTLDYTGRGPNGSLTGIGGELLNHTIDLGTPLSVFLPFRLKHLTFLHPLKSSRINIHFFQPTRREFQTFLLFKPFTWASWVGIYSVVLFAFVCITVLAIFDQETCFGKSRKYSVRNITFWMIGSFYTKAAFAVNPGAWSTKLAVLIVMMFSVIIMAIYTASIVVSLSTPFVPIKEFKDLLTNKYKISAYPGIPYFQQFIQNSELAEKLANESQKQFTSTKQAISEMFQTKESKQAVFEFDLGFYEICRSASCATDEQLCRASSFQADSIIPLSMFVRKSDPHKLKNTLNTKLLSLMERGLNNKYQTQYATFTQPLCQERELFTFAKATLKDVIAIHAVLVLGIIASFLSFAVERTHNKRNEKILILINHNEQI